MTGDIGNSFIVVLKPNSSVVASQLMVEALTLGNPNISVTAIYNSAVTGFAAKMTAEEAEAMAASDLIDYIEQDRTVYVDQVDTWGLDRVD